jgi:hypothetical protein
LLRSRRSRNAGIIPGTNGFSYNPASQIANVTHSNDVYAWNGHYNVDRNYTPNGLNQLTTAGSTSLGYDARGNLTTSGASAYTYTSENLLSSARRRVSRAPMALRACMDWTCLCLCRSIRPSRLRRRTGIRTSSMTSRGSAMPMSRRRRRPVAATLRLLNDPAAALRSHGLYREVLKLGAGKEQPGLDATLAWYRRNHPGICANLLQAARPGDRIIVFFGSRPFTAAATVRQRDAWLWLADARTYLPND